MKQGKTYINIILGLFVVVVACYFGYYMFSANYEGIRTATVIEYEAGSGCYTTGFVVRDEMVILSGYELTTVTVSEGERVATGQPIATGYRSTDAKDRQRRIYELEHELEQLDYAASYSADASEQAELESGIESHLQALNRSIARRDMNACVDRSAAIKGLVLRYASSEEELEDLNQRITALNAERQSLISQSGSDTKTVDASFSGSFSGSVDGYEDLLTPQALNELTISSLHAMEPNEVTDSVIGKIIRGSTWYYVAPVDAEAVADLRVGEHVPVSFVSSFYDDLTMRVERIGAIENGQRLLVLSCDRHMQEITLLREQSADIVFSVCSGLRVPKLAIHLHPETKKIGVYVLEAGAAEWKNVEILHDNGESYVVKLDKSSTDNLWPGDEVIITAEELRDGKVILE